MKLFFNLFLIFMLSACQTTSPKNPAEIESEINESIEEEGLAHLVEPKNTLSSEQKKYQNIWLKLAEGFDFEVPENERIKAQRDYFLSHPTYLKKVSKRAEPFLWLIVDQIEKNELPLELALLPVIESTFDPFAYSSAGASGMWQFMPASGLRFGLNQDWWYDGRRDVMASTGGALQYMTFLHRYLGDDWLYAFAAYNSGEGRVQRAVRKNKKEGKPVDYWNLDLPQETENYVPKLLALIDIIRNYEKYDIELPYITNQQVLTYVDIESQIDLAYAAELANLTLAELQLLNPAFNHWATSPDGPHKLLIPNISVDEFKTELAKIDKSKRIRWDRYLVKSGDSLSVIARKKYTTTKVLKQVNNLDSSFLRVGQPLLIPIASLSQQEKLSKQVNKIQSKTPNQEKLIHLVVEGDTLWDISRRYKVTSSDIAKWNDFSVKQTLKLGQKLTIWGKGLPNKITRHVTYSVRPGDSLGVIAQKFNVKTADLVRWNNIKEDQFIKPGQQLKVYVDVQKTRV